MSSVLHGRFAGGRSRLGGCPRACGGTGGTARGRCRLMTEARSLSRYLWSQRFCKVPADPSTGDVTLDFTLGAPIWAVESDEPCNPTEQDLAHVAAIFDDEERRLLTLLTDEEQELGIRRESVPEPVPTKGRDSGTLKNKLRYLKLGVEIIDRLSGLF